MLAACQAGRWFPSNFADTTDAVYGQLAGAYYGENGIPESWRTILTYRDRIVAYADQLLRLREGTCPGSRGSPR